VSLAFSGPGFVTTLHSLDNEKELSSDDEGTFSDDETADAKLNMEILAPRRSLSTPKSSPQRIIRESGLSFTMRHFEEQEEEANEEPWGTRVFATLKPCSSVRA